MPFDAAFDVIVTYVFCWNSSKMQNKVTRLMYYELEPCLLRSGRMHSLNVEAWRCSLGSRKKRLPTSTLQLCRTLRIRTFTTTVVRSAETNCNQNGAAVNYSYNYMNIKLGILNTLLHLLQKTVHTSSLLSILRCI